MICRRPAHTSDRLYRSNIVHRNPTELCDLGCGDDYSKLKTRTPRSKYNSQVIHHGFIESGDRPMKDAVQRDKLATTKDIQCFETGVSALMNNFPCLVIRAICDYADSHANNLWKGYAAMVAAVYAKDLLYSIDPEILAQQKTVANIVNRGTDVYDRDQPLNIDQIGYANSGILLSSTDPQRIPKQGEQNILISTTSTVSGDRKARTKLPDQSVSLEEIDSKPILRENGPWVKGLYSIGYSDQDAFDLICEKERDSP
ncbi:hypothetical protein N7478_011867 [Penicillium angulare]|uniref:uncharacterized protein n=1 Tax=Penicillium angulare TaxID=116970 RepID=UPI0025424075|nr:uncharacterized protein N7478_011867 [Penicillium angulare]KAJ5261272.1 hypothetical protein N7478_011867 [Penicillium angulare]